MKIKNNAVKIVPVIIELIDICRNSNGESINKSDRVEMI